MKHIFSILTLVVICLVVPVEAKALENMRSGETVVLSKDEIIESDYFSAGEKVLIDGEVLGDAYVAGGMVTVGGVINGDLLVAGGEVTINGEVLGDIRALGGNVTINGKVGQQLTMVGGNVSLSPSASVNGNAVVAGGNVSVLGQIGGDATIGAGELTFGSAASGDVVVGAEDVLVSSVATVGGKLTYWSEKEAVIQTGAVVGETTHYVPEKRTEIDEQAMKKAAKGMAIGWKVVGLLTTLLMGWLLLKTMPVFTDRVVKNLSTKTLASVGVGFLTLAATPVLVILLLVTIVGIPLAVVWVFMVLLCMWLSKLFVAVAVGEWIGSKLKMSWGKYLVFVVGVVTLSLVKMIPIIGWLVGLVACLAGLGALLLTKREYYQEMRVKKML